MTGRWRCPKGGATTTGPLEEFRLAPVLDETEETEGGAEIVLGRKPVTEARVRRGLRGGNGMGGSAGTVLSYRRATKLVSSRNEVLPKIGRLL